MSGPVPAPTVLAQHEREMLVGAFLDITVDGWHTFLAQHGDDQIPDTIHEQVAVIVNGLTEASRGNDVAYQGYLQALCLLSDSSLLWLVRHAGNNPLNGAPRC